MINKIPPQSLETEESILASCFLGHTSQAVNFITPDDFYRTAHQKIFRAIRDIYNKGEPVDLNTVGQHLKDIGQFDETGGYIRLAQIIDTVPLAVNIETYCKIIREKAILRKLITHCHKTIEECYNPQDDISLILEQSRKSISSIQNNSKSKLSSYSELSMTASDRYEELYNNQGKLTGIPSGYYDIDWFTCGFQATDFIIIAARPSMGKSALALNMAGNIAKNGDAALIFSLEMGKHQLFDRQVSGESCVNLQKFKSGRFIHEDWTSLTETQAKVYNWPVYIDDSAALHYSLIRSRAYSAIEKHDIKIIFVDYLQLIRGDKESSRDREVAGISAAMKAMAKEFEIPVVVLSQLNRSLENRKDKKPRLSDLRDSGTLEQDSDVIMFLYRPGVYGEKESYEGHTELEIAKHRNGPTGLVNLIWQDKYTRFLNKTRGKDKEVSQ